MNSKVYEVLDKITDSDDTTVGGGCASALSGAMAARYALHGGQAVQEEARQLHRGAV